MDSRTDRRDARPLSGLDGTCSRRIESDVIGDKWITDEVMRLPGRPLR